MEHNQDRNEPFELARLQRWREADVTLTCGWCGEEIDGVQALLDRASGRLLLPRRDEHYELAGRLPRCRSCGGPLFIENWKLAA